MVVNELTFRCLTFSVHTPLPLIVHYAYIAYSRSSLKQTILALLFEHNFAFCSTLNEMR